MNREQAVLAIRNAFPAGGGLSVLDAIETLIAEARLVPENDIIDANMAWLMRRLGEEHRFQAAKAMAQGLLANGSRHPDSVPGYSVALADALLAEPAKTRGPA